MDNRLPKVSVILPIYNGDKYLRNSISSILSQTFSDFELLAIDDASSDKSSTILRSFSDKRIKIISNQRNKGLIGTLNKGIKLARGEYIARMDQDDISASDRLEKQVRFLDRNLKVGIVGTSAKIIDINGVKTGVEAVLTRPKDISNALMVINPFVHGSVMIRRSVLDGAGLHYNKQALHVEDYKLWMDLSLLTDLANLPELLYSWRINPEGITSTYNPDQMKNTDLLRNDYWKRMTILGKRPNVRLSEVLAAKNYYLNQRDSYLHERLNTLMYTAVRRARMFMEHKRPKDAYREVFSTLIAFPFNPHVYYYLMFMLFPKDLFEGIRRLKKIFCKP